MNPPVIGCTNFVSTTKGKRKAERSVNWTEEETRVLLCTWSAERIQRSLAENHRNRCVFKQLSARMSELGFCRSPRQCQLRVKTLKANYVRAKLQRSVDSSQPCSFRYFEEMDAVLGRRTSQEGFWARHVGAFERTGNVRPNSHSRTEAAGLHFEFSEGSANRHLISSEGNQGLQSWRPDVEVKVEEQEVSTADYEADSDTGFSPTLPDRQHNVFLEPEIHRGPGTPVENTLCPPSPPPPSPPPPPPPTQPTAHSLPSSPSPSPGPGPYPTSSQPNNQSPSMDPMLRHLLGCFQRLVAETRGLLVELEGQRQEQARLHQDLLGRWLELEERRQREMADREERREREMADREERRQREMADREERRERARMEHELKVLELLSGATQQRAMLSGPDRTATGGNQSDHRQS